MENKGIFPTNSGREKKTKWCELFKVNIDGERAPERDSLLSLHFFVTITGFVFNVPWKPWDTVREVYFEDSKG